MKILIVEDARPIREGLGKVLAKLNQSYEVVGMAADGIEGLKLMEELTPELVIMDIQMPDMDGLTMLAEARKRNVSCRFIVLTAYSDFNYAKKAIELGIDNYLLKPIKIHELKKALKQVEKAMAKTVNPANIYTKSYIFQGALSGNLVVDEALEQVVAEQYGLKTEEEVGLFVLWLGDFYENYHTTASMLLDGLGESSGTFESYLAELEDRQVLISFLYGMKDCKKTEEFLRTKIVPMLSSNLEHRGVYGWGVAKGLLQVKDEIRQVAEDMNWNLLYENPRLISHKMVEETVTVPLKLPPDLEQKIRYAVAHKNREELEQCLSLFMTACQSEPHNPKETKDACIRFCFTVINGAKEYGLPIGELSVQDLSARIGRSVSWKELRSMLNQVLTQILSQDVLVDQGERSTSELVLKAQVLIQEYYNQGITLEEIARRLYVTEEYLSAQIKKETGQTFTEIIRLCRINEIKKLLLESDLKLNQIAAMAGYSDPKYMSKVFRDEVGMSPADYRKMNI